MSPAWVDTLVADTALDHLVAELVLSVRDWIPDAARAALPELARLRA